MLKCPGGEGEGRRDLVGRKKEGAFYVSMLSSFWPRRVCPAYQVVDIWLRDGPLEKRWGGGGDEEFSACTNFFFRPLLVQDFFFQVNPSE